MTKIGRVIAEYARLTRVIARAEKKRKTIREFLKRRMESSGQDVIREEGLRVLRYPTRKVEWDVLALGGVLERAGCPEHIMARVFVTMVNEDELNDLVEQGLVDLEEVSAAGKVRTGWSIRVDPDKEA